MGDREEKIEFLKSYRNAKLEEEIYKTEAEAIIGCKLLPSLMMNGMPSAHNAKDLSHMSELIEEKCQEYMNLRHKSVRTATKVIDSINRLSDTTEKRVLLERYIKYKKDFKLKSWEEIAEVVGYSKSRTMDYHTLALENLQINC